jgi:hypothetical protein
MRWRKRRRRSTGKQQHHGRADKPSPSEYKVKMHEGSKPGDWQGAYVPVHPVNAAKLIREISGRA